MREQSIDKYISLGYDESYTYMLGWIHGYEDRNPEDYPYDIASQEYLDYWHGYNQGCRDY